MSCCGNCEKNKEEILKKIDGFSHQIFSYHLDLLQFMDMIYDFIQDTDIQGIKNKKGATTDGSRRSCRRTYRYYNRS